MTETTRARLGAYFLFALLLLSVPVTLTVSHYEAKSKAMRWVRKGDRLQFVNVNSRESGIRFLMERDGISRKAAERITYQTERQTKTRLTEVEDLPLNCQLDYYVVDGRSAPQSASYEGSALLLDAKSEQATAVVEAWKQHPEFKKNREFARFVKASLDQGFLLAPLGIGGADPASFKKSPVVAASSFATRNKPRALAKTDLPHVAIIATKFPGFRDIAPHSDGDTDANDTVQPYVDYNTHLSYPGGIDTGSNGHAIGSYGTTYAPEACYRSVAPANPPGSSLPVLNWATVADGGTDLGWDTNWPYCHSVFDSVGGPFSTTGTWGIPIGIPNPWDWAFPAVMPHSNHDSTGDLQNYFFDLMYDQSTTSQAASNWFYYQTHGAVRPWGDRTDVVGWLYNGHQCNRYDWQTGGGNLDFIFPGTPVIRPVPAAGADPGIRQIVRATLSSRGLTILFSREVQDLRASEVTLTAYTRSDISENTGTQYGDRTINWDLSNEGVVMDPYDARRWTITNPGGNSWQFYLDDTSSPPSLTAGTFVAYDNATWDISVNHGGAFAKAPNWQRNQFMGCDPLENTEITTADLRIASSEGGSGSTLSRPKNRLLDLSYYTHAYVPGASYQIKHMRNEWGRDDDISGTSVPAGDTYRTDRPYPFDHEADDPPNKGYWPVTGEKNGGNHKFGVYAGHAAQIMADNGVSTPAGSTVIHVNADCPNAHDVARQYVQPISSLYLNENDARLTYFHEMGHNMADYGDLYDMDFVRNQTPPIPVPLFHECPAMDPYSFMAQGGGRVDAVHLASSNAVSVTPIQRDTLGVQIPAIEGLLRDPVIIKLPANPYYIKWGISPDAWQEYFLLENRNYNVGNTNNGAFTTDSSPRGLYIYHIDTRGPGKWNVAEGGDQRDDNVLSVIVEQADGKYDLHYNDKGNWGVALTTAEYPTANDPGANRTLLTDPFGDDTACRVTRFWQFPMLNGEDNDFAAFADDPAHEVRFVSTTAGNGQPVGSPPSWSHGYTYAERDPGGANLLIPGTESDSFTRVVKIGPRGDNMSADIYVEPAEIIPSFERLTTSLTRVINTVSRAANVVTVTTTAAHGFKLGETVGISGVANSSFNGNFEIASIPSPMTFTYAQTDTDANSTGGTAKTGEIRQGARDVEFLKLILTNPDGTGVNSTDLSKMSIKDVYIDKLYVLESGTSNTPADILAAKVYVDNDNDGVIDPGEPMLKSVALTNGGTYHDYAVFTGLGYRLPLGSTRNLILAYDIAGEAQINPRISVGTEFTNARRIEPRLPGCVQDKQRLDANPGENNRVDPYNFGTSQFPIYSATAVIVGYPDALVITPSFDGLPKQAAQTQADVPMLKLTCAVDDRPNGSAGSVRIDSVMIDAVTGAGYMDAVSDVVSCRLFRDNGDGVFDAGTDTEMASSTFTPEAGTNGRANFPNLNEQVNYGSPKVLWFAVTLASPDPGEKLKLSLDFPGGGGQPQGACYVQLINNATEANENKDYVEWRTANGATWPMTSDDLVVIQPNKAPGQPVAPFYPAAGDSISDITPRFTWGEATDDDDASTELKYNIQIADNTSFTNPISKQTGKGENFYQLADTDALTQGKDYYWRIQTVDPKDATSAWTLVTPIAPGNPFHVIANRPPNPVAAAPAPGFQPTGQITTLTPTISWNETTDPDASDGPETLRYCLQIDDNSDFSTPLVLHNVGGAAPAWEAWDSDPWPNGQWARSHQNHQNSYVVVGADNLQWGTTYYYRIVAEDVAGAQSDWATALVRNFTPVQDSAPYVPGSGNAPNPDFSPTNDIEVSSKNPVLAWSMPNPPDPDPTDTIDTIRYRVQLKKVDPTVIGQETADFGTGVVWSWTTTAGTQQWIVNQAEGIGIPPGLDLEDDGHYYWRVRAIDDEGQRSDWSPTQSFWVNLVNDAPNPPDSGFDPSNGEQIGDSTPYITWNHATDPDQATDTWNTLHYVLELTSTVTGGVADFTTPVQQCTSGVGENYVTVGTPLTDKTTWYYRVKTVDNEGAESVWSATQSFRLDVGNVLPTLSIPAAYQPYGCVPRYGHLAPRTPNYFQLYVMYTDPENDAATWVKCTFDTGLEKDMSKLNPADNDARDGIIYVVGVGAAELGLGAHTHRFSCLAGVSLPVAPALYSDPIIGADATCTFISPTGVHRTDYEEGKDVWVRVTDDDENSTPTALNSVQVTVSESGGDSETFTLSETGVNTGIFEGFIRSYGRAGADNDGKLNAIAGTLAGNQITASYVDKDDGASPDPDSRTDLATVYDTISPYGINAALSVASGPHGTTADLNWTSYDEDGQVDVQGYKVWYQTAPFSSTTGLTEVAILPAKTAGGTATYTVTGLTPNTDYWFGVSAYDEIPNERTNIAPVKLTTKDSVAPVMSGETPARDATEVLTSNTSLSFYLDDLGVGVKRNSLAVTVRENGTVIPFKAPTYDSTDRKHQLVTLQPLEDGFRWHWNATVTVQVNVTDFSGNAFADNTWTFYTVTDHENPTADELLPAADATNVPVTTNVGLTLHDTPSGIDQSRVRMLFNDVDVTDQLQFVPAANGLRVLYDPNMDLSYSSTYEVEVIAYDIAGNQLAATEWSFRTVVDSSSVTFDQFDPERDATDVDPATNISLRLSDPQAGIQRSTFRMWVYNVEVTNSAGLTITQTPPAPAEPSTMQVTYNPPEDLPYGTDIRVRVYVKDRANNIADLTYKFRTADAPTYSIAGVVTRGDGSALAGVTITAAGQTTTTDGTGGYRLDGILEGTYVVTPTKDQYLFEPVSTTVTLGPDDATETNFVGRLQTYAIRGRVTEAGTGLKDVSIACDGKSGTTDAQGYYTITGLPNGQYTVKPTLSNYHFQPESRAAQINGADATGVNFDAVADTFKVEGVVEDNFGNAVEGVTITCGSKVVVTNAVGLYTVSGLRAGSYPISAAKAGYTIEGSTTEVAVPPDQTNINFTAYIEITNSFPAGYNLIGVPGAPNDTNPMTVFGTGLCYRWNPDLVPPTYAVAQNNPTLEFVQVKPGRGFFVKLDAAKTLRIPGRPTAAGQSISIGLSEGWNMIANPFTTPTEFGNFTPSVTDGIRPFAFIYDNATGSYKMVSSVASLGAERDSLLGWEGAWVRAVAGGVSLQVTSSSSAAADMAPQQADLKGGWSIPIQARAGNRADLTTVAAVVPGSHKQHVVENPPTAPATVDVYFVGEGGARLAHDVRTQDKRQVFDFVVACAVPDSKVTVTLPDLSGVPADQQVLLVDKQAGKTLYARTMPTYTYRSKGAASERNFQLIVEPRTIGALAVTATASSSNEGVALTYTVTRGCSVTIRVMNLAGRCVKVLSSDKPVTAGVQTELWNLTGVSGTKVPAGVYLMQIEATTEIGQRVRSVAPVRIGN